MKTLNGMMSLDKKESCQQNQRRRKLQRMKLSACWKQQLKQNQVNCMHSLSLCFTLNSKKI